jgi:membrane protease YdiL (CAAX protease family)
MNGTAAPPVTLRDSLRGYGPAAIVVTIAIVAAAVAQTVVAAVLILLWAWWSKTPWAEIGYAKPGSWVGGALIGIAFGIAFKIAMKALVMPLLGAPAVNPAYHFLAGNLGLTLEFAAIVVVAVGWAEETVYRGWLFERLEKLLGRSAGATILIVLLTSVIFGAAHYTGQGLAGVEQATVVGFVFATIYAITRRLWMLIWAHTAFDLTAAAMIYLDAETRVSHLVFQ